MARSLRLLSVALVAVALLVLTFSLVIAKSLNHDEHQHVAAGALLVREGLLPCKDYPFFHMPYLPVIHAGLFALSDYLLFSARLFSAVCASAAGVVLFCVARHRLAVRPHALWLAFGAVALFATAAQFTHTTGRAWNQEPGMLCALLWFVAYAASFHRAHPGRYVFAAGLLLGLSVGIRITFAPLVGAFLIMLACFPPPEIPRLRLFTLAAFGLATALLPALALFLAAPEQFVFGNLEFAKFNILYRHGTGNPRTMTMLKKLRFVVKEIVRPNLPLVLAFAGCVGAAIALAWRARVPAPRELKLVLLTLPFLLIGSLAPSPLFEQYFYPFVPFLVLGIIFALASLRAELSWKWSVAFAACVIFSIAQTAREYELHRLVSLRKWAPLRLHERGVELSQLVPSGGTVLTLAPLSPLEGKLKIYPPLATGAFAWRTAPFVPASRRASLHLLSPEELPNALAVAPPSAILLGYEEKGEEPLAEFAVANGFALTQVSGGHKLWLAPRLEPK